MSPLEAEKPGALDRQRNIYKLYLDIQPVSFISLMNHASSKRRVIASMEMLESASELLKCSITHLTRHLQKICFVQLSVLITSIFLKVRQIVWNFQFFSMKLKYIYIYSPPSNFCRLSMDKTDHMIQVQAGARTFSFPKYFP